MSRWIRPIRLVGGLLLAVMLVSLAGCARKITMPPETSYSPELKQRAERGNLRAQHQLGLSYWFGRGVQQDSAEGLAWLNAAAEKNYAPSQYVVGAILMGMDEEEKAFDIILKAADQGIAEAQVQMGDFYNHGTVVPRDVAQAIQWYEKGGQGGIGHAYFLLGFIHAAGDGVPKDTETAARYWKKSAEMGYMRGQDIYAWHLATASRARERNGREAVRWAQQAVRQRRDCCTLDSLAAAYAENRQFDLAVETQKEAIAKLENVDQETWEEWGGSLPSPEELEARLALYRQSKPYRAP